MPSISSGQGSYLIDDYVIGVDLEAGQLLHEALGLEEAQELGDADAHKRRQLRVLELLVDLLHDGLATQISVLS